MNPVRPLAAALVAALALLGLAGPAQAAPRPVASIGVMSDIHIMAGDDRTNDHLVRAISQLYATSPRLDGIVAVGDVTDNGLLPEYEKLMRTFRSTVRPETRTIFTMGNHETYNGLSRAESDRRFLEQTGMPALNTHNVINGIHLIGLNWTPSGADVAWLEQQLAEAAKADKHAPILVFFHYPLRDTVYGSAEWGMDNQAMYAALARYPQAITFSGHSHYPSEDPRSIMQKDFTAINNGVGLNYLELEKGRVQGNIPSGAHEIAQDLLVNVYPNKVEVLRLDVHTGKPAGEPWEIKLPVKQKKFTYTPDRDTSAPTFTGDAGITGRGTGLRTATVSFDQARDDLMVHHYELKAVNLATGRADATTTAFSEFYRDPVPPRLTFDMGGLTPGSAYRLEVTAVDSFGNRSRPVSTQVVTDSVELVAVTTDPAILRAGQPGTVAVTVKNWGTAPVVADVRLTVDGPVTLERPTVQVPVRAGQTATVEVAATVTDTRAATATITATGSVFGRPIGTRTAKVFVNHLLGETFDSVPLQPAVDEKIGFDGFSHQAPAGWTITNSAAMPQGMTEWQGWSITTPRFWVAADNQDRDRFTLASGNIAVADPDEWDDKGSPASKGRFDSRLTSPQVPVAAGRAYTLAFDSHYLQENPQRASVVAVYDNGATQTLLDYGPSGENNGQHAMNRTVTKQLAVPAGATGVRIEFRMYDAGNNWYWGIDNVRLS